MITGLVMAKFNLQGAHLFGAQHSSDGYCLDFVFSWILCKPMHFILNTTAAANTLAFPVFQGNISAIFSLRSVYFFLLCDTTETTLYFWVSNIYKILYIQNKL